MIRQQILRFIATSVRPERLKGHYKSYGWQTGYGAFPVSQSNVEAVVQYTETQAEHHKKLTFQDELLALFQRHGIAFDERYVWD